MAFPFPAEAIPDGHVSAPHHAYTGLLGVLFVAGVVWDDYREREPLAVAVGALGSYFAFAYVWRWYPVLGASLFGVGLAVVLAGVLSRWPGVYSRRWQAAVLVCWSVALDDWLSHAFAVWTPLDAFWAAVYAAGLVG